MFEKYYQAFDTVFYHQIKHLEVRQKYSAWRRIFNLLGVSSGDETLRLMLDILLQDMFLLFFCRSKTGLECTICFFSKVERHPFL